MDPKSYEGREQAFVKHTVLQHYLQVLALKVGQFTPGTTLNYVDGFSGPWDDGSALPSDVNTSPYIALTQLRNAREHLRQRAIDMRVRAMFVEKNADSFARLEMLCAGWNDVETERIHGEFEEHVEQAVRFASDGPAPFAFVFIDPKGWTGFGLRKIAPLLRVSPSEVLVNFMLKDILRFVDKEHAELRRGFEDLFGQSAEAFRQRWNKLEGIDREDAIVEAYRDRLGETGGFKHVTSAVIVNPQKDRTHYHLVYATRSRRGLLAFREAEQKAMRLQAAVRASVRQSARQKKTGQAELFDAEAMETPFIDTLASRYNARARQAAETALGPTGALTTYEALVDSALVWPMTGEKELKTWIAEWQATRLVELLGLEGRERVPKLGKNHRVRRLR